MTIAPTPSPRDDLAHGGDPDGGPELDLPRFLPRRRALALLAGAGASAVLAACGSGEATSSTTTASDTTVGDAAATSATSTTSTTGDGECLDPVPEETAGPYPGDGSNGPDVLTESGVVRRDIRSSFGDLSGTAEGVPLTFELTILDGTNGCAPYAGAALYLWHADRDGRYSLYSRGVTDQNYLRGVQEADSSGRLSFQSIYPGCYDGRWPHAHFEVFPSLAEATSAGSMLVTSQIAFPEATCAEVYDAATGYEQSVANLARTSLERDMVFRDGWTLEMATLRGDPERGYTAQLTIVV